MTRLPPEPETQQTTEEGVNAKFGEATPTIRIVSGHSMDAEERGEVDDEFATILDQYTGTHTSDTNDKATTNEARHSQEQRDLQHRGLPVPPQPTHSL